MKDDAAIRGCTEVHDTLPIAGQRPAPGAPAKETARRLQLIVYSLILSFYAALGRILPVLLPWGFIVLPTRLLFTYFYSNLIPEFFQFYCLEMLSAACPDV